jgi:murein DD-endopeptidase MepM/ murein hydrolase activator NlpD
VSKRESGRSSFSRDASAFLARPLEKALRLKPLLRPLLRKAAACCATAGLALALLSGARAAPPARDDFPASVPQGSLVIGQVAPGSTVRYAGRALRVTPAGAVVFGIGRDEAGPVRVDVSGRDGRSHPVAIAVRPREWPVERVVGVPPATVEPPPEIAERIRREQARVVAARDRDDARADFLETFVWPVAGRISGRFGNQRVYVANGKDVPKSPHSGMDIAAPQGTPIKAPASGLVTFADADLYLTGGTVLIDHGHGVSSNFLHLSRLDVKVGDRVEQGQVIGAVGKTGRATGPHLHWGLNWFDVRLDPLLLPGIEGT